MIEEIKTDVTNKFTHYVGVSFANSARAYYFGMEDISLKIGDRVVVETIRGIELGFVAYEPISISKYKSELALKPIVRKASDVDIRLFENNLEDIKRCQICHGNLQK